MTIDDKIWDEKLQYNINTEATKILAWSTVKIDECEYLTGQEILPSNKRQILEQGKFAYSSLEKASEKQTKMTEDKTSWSIRCFKSRKKSKTEINWRTFSKRNGN